MAQRALKTNDIIKNRRLHEVVELTEDCELGKKGERAVVTQLWDDRYMSLLFPNRDAKWQREVNTGADYKFLKGV